MTEVLLAVVVMAMIMPYFWGLAKSGFEDRAMRVAAGHLERVSSAAARYVEDNYATLQAAATPVTAAVVTVPTLVAGSYLPAGFSAVNPWRQTTTIYVLEPVAGDLQTIVLTSGGRSHSAAQPEFGNQVVPKAAAVIGARGGYVPTGSVPSESVNILQGAYGGWRVNISTTTIPNPGAGHLASLLYFDDGALGAADYLHRVSVPGRPELNQMQTSLDLTNNDINNVGTVNATAVNSTTVTATTVNGTTVNATTVNAGQAILPAGNNLQIGASRFYGDASNSAARQSGDFYVQDLTGATPRSVISSRVVDGDNVAFLVDPAGTSNLNTLDVANLRINGVDVGDRLPRYVHLGTSLAANGSTIAKPACGPGGTPRIMVNVGLQRSRTPAFNNETSHRASAVDLGWGWRVDMRTWGLGGIQISGSVALANLYCQY